MSSVVISGDTSGTITLSAPLVSGSNTQTLAAVTGTLAPIVSGTAVASTSGTSIDFTGIPSWVKRITVMFDGVSLSGTSDILVQLGDSGGIENTGYSSVSTTLGTASTTQSTSTSGLVMRSVVATNSHTGQMILSNLNGNVWVENYGSYNSSASSVGGGSKTLSGTLNQVRITTVNGTDTFDAGSINILYE